MVLADKRRSRAGSAAGVLLVSDGPGDRSAFPLLGGRLLVSAGFLVSVPPCGDGAGHLPRGDGTVSLTYPQHPRFLDSLLPVSPCASAKWAKKTV
jgi:hypothetical protein